MEQEIGCALFVRGDRKKETCVIFSQYPHLRFIEEYAHHPTCDVTLSTVVVGNQTAEIYLWALVEPTKQLGYNL